ncbi:hypothetical protein MYX76_13990 [Desulfobacterota bacterium AH_259_B03_O07]|nr:hypothetical protein [Desulfobacterota bacterium AH_259_B03_O07]
MNENFLRMLNGLKKEDLIYLLKIYDYYPEEKREEYNDFFGRNITKPAKKWIKGLKYYDPKKRKKDLYELLKETILKSCKIKQETNLDTAANKIVTKIAELNKVAIDSNMTTREIENQLFLNESEEMFLINLITVRSMVLMSTQETVGVQEIQRNIIKSFIEELIATKDQKVILENVLVEKFTIDDIKELVSEIKKKKNLNVKQLFASILGLVWIIAISDDMISRKEITFYNNLFKELGIKDNDAIQIKHKSEQNFEEVREKTLNELNKKGNKIGDSDITTTVNGIAGSLVVLGLAEAAGFGLFLFATNALFAIGSLFGVTFAFSTYTTLTTILGILTGPIGWLGIPALIGGGVILLKIFDNVGYEKTKKVVIKLSYLRADI